MLELPMYTVDSFSNQPFTGNPAAVCLDVTENGINEELMQKIGAEMNISETSFIQKVHDTDNFETANRFKLRWFTPTSEVPLCGHATLASAAVLFHCVGNSNKILYFETKSGELTAEKRDGNIALDLPINKPRPAVAIEFEDLIKLVVGELPLHSVLYSDSTKKLLLRLSDEIDREQLEKLSPPSDKLILSRTAKPIAGVIVTLKGCKENGAISSNGKTYDFISRYFAPWVGIPEDPVTGAAHTVLSPYWAEELQKSNLYARQCSKRGGDLNLVVGNRLDISGPATIVLKGTIHLNHY